MSLSKIIRHCNRNDITGFEGRRRSSDTLPTISCHEGGKPWFGRAGEFNGLFAPGEFEAAGMEGVVRENEFGALGLG
jgi:hypothetical protein